MPSDSDDLLRRAERDDIVVESPIEVDAAHVKGFSEFGVSEPIVEALALRNIDHAFDIQALVLKDAISGRDVLARSRTGSGKTLAFAIPIVEQLTHDRSAPSAMILVPTRELASQVAEEFRGVADVKQVKLAAVFGGVPIKEQAARAKSADVLIATPGRLLDLVRRGLLSLKRVRIAVLDEADRMLDMGFLPDVDKIMQMLSDERQTMFFSATLDGEVGRLAARYTVDAIRHEIIEDRPIVELATHRFISVRRDEKLDVLVRELAGDRGLTLIFVNTKRFADRLAMDLKARGFGAQALHGDMTQPAREKALARFATGKADVLVATDVAARGLDLEHISHVVNYDPPGEDKSYVHRVGRTARAGRTGMGITLVSPDEAADVSRMAKRLQLHAEFVESGMKIAPPQMVYTSRRGRGSLLGKRPRRRF